MEIQLNWQGSRIVCTECLRAAFVTKRGRITDADPPEHAMTAQETSPVQAVCVRAAHLLDVPVKETPAAPSLVNVEVIWDCASREQRSKWAEDAGLLRVSAFARDLPWWSALPSDEWRARLVPHVRLAANRGEDR